MTAIALYGSWGVLVRTLEHGNETNNTAKARKILKKIEQFNICSISCHATWFLGVIAKLFKAFQKDNIDVDQMNDRLN